MGEVRPLKAVFVESLGHLVNVLVFPAPKDPWKRTRPHTNECSGSDLDGDRFLSSYNNNHLKIRRYFVCWDENLQPLRELVKKSPTYVEAEPVQPTWYAYEDDDDYGYLYEMREWDDEDDGK